MAEKEYNYGRPVLTKTIFKRGPFTINAEGAMDQPGITINEFAPPDREGVFLLSHFIDPSKFQAAVNDFLAVIDAIVDEELFGENGKLANVVEPNE